MANYMGVFGFVIVSLTLHGASAATYIVLDNSGWIVPGNDSVYRTWSASKNFQIGDTLVFNFAAGRHDVAEVSKAGYDACNGTAPLKLELTNPASLTLDTNGEHYYICTFEGHCLGGQMLAITVGNSNSTPTPSPSSPPSSPATPVPLSPPNMPPQAPSPNTPPQAPLPNMPPTTPCPPPPSTTPTPMSLLKIPRQAPSPNTPLQSPSPNMPSQPSLPNTPSSGSSAAAGSFFIALLSSAIAFLY